MKTAVSIPEEVFAEAEALARRQRVSRSRLYSRALAEYVARHAPERVTETMNRVVDEVGAGPDPFVEQAARAALARVEW
jgi:metal-responsive CopG/Arc/MetJ family transcriptional regulator